jgi:phage terminase Nu1 subunit (DNA packaging protein)
MMAARKTKKRGSKTQPAATILKGWQQIAAFLGQPVNVAQRWAKQGMPVKREGRFVTTTRDDLNQWLGRESGEPVHVTASDEGDLSAELKRALSYVRGQKRDR